MSEHVDHVVVGGGVMGAATAWQLARRGAQVVLLERFGRGHVRGASHGASRIYRNTYARAEYLDLVQEAFDLWRGLEDEAPAVGELLTITGGVSQGSLASREVADAFVERGIPHEWLSAADAHARWPGLAFEGDVLHETQHGGPAARRPRRRGVPPGRHRRGCPGAARDAGARGRADRRRGAGGHRHGHLARDERRRRGRRLDVRAARRHPRAGRPAGGDAGAACALRAAAGRTRRRPVAVVHARPAGAAPVAQRRLRPGRPPARASRSGFHGVGPRTDPDRRTFTPEPGQLAPAARLRGAVGAGRRPDHLVPISCTYTTTPDHDFVLDRRGRVVVAAGFSGHGFKFAPAVGRVLADLASEPAYAAHPAFAAARLAALPA